jgi:hypothetical protein
LDKLKDLISAIPDLYEWKNYYISFEYCLEESETKHTSSVFEFKHGIDSFKLHGIYSSVVVGDTTGPAEIKPGSFTCH